MEEITKQGKTKAVKVRADSLAIHPRAQRDLVPARLKRLEANLDFDAIGTLYAVDCEIRGQRKLWVIDGQHRLQALLNHGFGEWLVNVEVFQDVKDDSRACELFVKLNDRSPVAPYFKFTAEVKAGISVAVGVSSVVRKHQLEIGQSSEDGKVACFAALRKLWQLDSGHTLSSTLELVLSAWGHTSSAVEGKLLEGIGAILHKYNSGIDRPALVAKLSKYPGGAPGIVGDARGLMGHRKGKLSRCISQCVIEAYNNGKRINKLEVF